MVLLGGRYANASGILHPKTDHRLVGRTGTHGRPQPDTSAFGELKGVAQQVKQHLVQPVGIARHAGLHRNQYCR